METDLHGAPRSFTELARDQVLVVVLNPDSSKLIGHAQDKVVSVFSGTVQVLKPGAVSIVRKETLEVALDGVPQRGFRGGSRHYDSQRENYSQNAGGWTKTCKALEKGLQDRLEHELNRGIKNQKNHSELP